MRWRDDARAAVAAAATGWSFAASFGLVDRASAMGVLAPLVTSATMLGGSERVATASIPGGSGAAVAAIAAAVLPNARHAPVPTSVAPLFRGPRQRRLPENN